MIIPIGFFKKFIKQLFKKNVKFIVINNTIDPTIFENYLRSQDGRNRIRKVINNH